MSLVERVSLAGVSLDCMTVLSSMVPWDIDSGALRSNAMVQSTLRRLAHYTDRREALFRQPAWLSGSRVAALAAEARGQSELLRPDGLQLNDSGQMPHYLPTGLAVAELTSDTRFTDAIAAVYPGRCLGSPSNTSYVSYSTRWQRCPLHIDDADRFEFTVLICVKHVRPPDVQPSSLMVLDSSGLCPKALSVGDAFVFHSAARPHLRSPMADGEQVCLLSVGFVEVD